ncbi:MAG: hypothetical protein E7065_01885 [Lentimicrobiaceae bacterium]|nr:hypothetical protein [Lentimicrobiaceae bacterium]
MKKLRSLSLLILVLLSNIVMAQYIRVLPVSTDNIGNNAAEMLHDRLNQAVSLNGMASTDNSNKFLLIPSVTVTSVEPTTTIPVQYVAEIEISLSLVDNSRKLLISQEILTRKGVADNENSAVTESIKSLKGRDPKLKKLIVNAKNEIIEYYNTECEKIIETITAYIEMEMYDEALDELNAIPQTDADLECYKNSIDILNKISVEQQTKSNNIIRNENPDVSWIND